MPQSATDIAALAPIIAAIASVVVAFVSGVFSPTITERIKQRAAREGRKQDGWAIAVDHLEARVNDLVEDVDRLTTRVSELSQQLSERDQRIAAQEITIAEQSRSLKLANGRVRQLESTWPPGFSLPAPDPGHP